jgi:hypothetical protein
MYSGFKQEGHTILMASSTNFGTFVGQGAGRAVLADGLNNTAIGYQALAVATSTDGNTAVGYQALTANTVGLANTAVGYQALVSNTFSSFNTAVGYRALRFNTGTSNTAFGYSALGANTTGTLNVAIGTDALGESITGGGNIAIGTNALLNNQSATSTIAIGVSAAAGGANYASQRGVYVGYQSGLSVITGSDNNTFLGYNSGAAVSSGANNTLLGYRAGDTLTTGSNNLIIGYDVDAPAIDTSNYLNIGNVIYGNSLTSTGVASTGYIGIGTTTPRFLLQLATTTAPQLVLSGGDTSNGWAFRNSGGMFYLATSSPTTFATSTATALSIDGTTGNVGVGTNSPTSNLSVAAPAVSTGINLLNNANFAITRLYNENQSGRILLYNSGQNLTVSLSAGNGLSNYINTGTNFGLGDTSPDFALETVGSFGLSSVAGGDGDILVARSSGFVGIGTTTPQWLLQLATTTSPQLTLTAGATDNHWSFSNAGGTFYLSTSSPTTFATSTTAALAINTSGNVGIGSSTPTYKLDVAGYVNVGTFAGYKQEGHLILYASSTNFSTLVGRGAGVGLLSDGLYNTAIGYKALMAATSTDENTAIGYEALAANIDGGSQNTAVGHQSLLFNTTGSGNTALGRLSLYRNTAGYQNTAIGVTASRNSVSGLNNTAIGHSAMYSNITGGSNTALGVSALFYNNSATSSVAVGESSSAGLANYSNQGGVTVGRRAGRGFETGSDYNTLLGFAAGNLITTGANNIFVGANSTESSNNLTTGSKNISIGYNIALPSDTASNQLNIGNLIYGSNLSGTGSTVAGYLGIGTTTPRYLLQLSTTTAPQLVLSGGDTSNSWAFRNSGGMFYLATSSPTSFATSTVSALAIDGFTGNVTIPTLTSTTVCLTGDICRTTWPTAGGSSFNFPYTTLGTGENSTSTTLAFNNGFLSNASSTLTNFTFSLATGTQATTTNLYSNTLTTNDLRVGNTVFSTLTEGLFTLNGPNSSTPSMSIADGGTTVVDIGDGGGASDIGRMRLYNNGTANIIFDAGNTSYLNTGSNFGIGTTTPQWKLQVAGTDAPQLTLSDSATPTANHWSFRNSGGIFYLATSSPTTFATSTVAALAIDNNGNIGIGSSTPTYKLDVAGFINTNMYGGFKQEGHTILFASTTNFSTLVGQQAGQNLLTDGLNSTALGYQALRLATSSDSNTAVGYQALAANTIGSTNTAIGHVAMTSNITGTDNVAVGSQSLTFATYATSNTAVGFRSMRFTTTGGSNVAIGNLALTTNTTGGSNVAIGSNALGESITGTQNVVIGTSALQNNQSATSTVAIGNGAGVGGANYTNQRGVYIGTSAGAGVLTGSDNNIFLGYQAGNGVTTGANNLIIGYDADSLNDTISNYMNIGNIIYGVGISGTGTTTAGFMGVGTTTPRYLLQLATTTAPQLVLSGGDTSNSWAFRNSGGMFYLATSSPTTFATSTVAALVIDGTTGNVGIGTTTPGAKLNIIGALCVDDSTPTCANAERTEGTIYSVAALSSSLDLAESYPTRDMTLSAGEIVMLDNINPMFVSRSLASSTTPLIGIVSTNPGFWLGGFNDEVFRYEKKLPIALSGRVPTKVNSEGGEINIGDRIALSSVPGVGKKATSTDYTVGIALESMSNQQGTIEVFVTLDNPTKSTELVALENRISGLELNLSLSSSALNVSTSTNESLISTVLNAFGATISDMVVTFKKVVIEALTIGKSDKPAGITFFDTVTGEPYCFTITNGSPTTTQGECDSTPLTTGGSNSLTTGDSTSTTTSGGSDTSVPESVIPIDPEPDSTDTSVVVEPNVVEQTVEIVPEPEPVTPESTNPTPAESNV